ETLAASLRVRVLPPVKVRLLSETSPVPVPERVAPLTLMVRALVTLTGPTPFWTKLVVPPLGAPNRMALVLPAAGDRVTPAVLLLLNCSAFRMKGLGVVGSKLTV